MYTYRRHGGILSMKIFPSKLDIARLEKIIYTSVYIQFVRHTYAI